MLWYIGSLFNHRLHTQFNTGSSQGNRKLNKTQTQLFPTQTGQSKLFLKTETQQKSDSVWTRHNGLTIRDFNRSSH